MYCCHPGQALSYESARCYHHALLEKGLRRQQRVTAAPLLAAAASLPSVVQHSSSCCSLFARLPASPPRPCSPNARPTNRKGACIGSAALQMRSTCAALAAACALRAVRLGEEMALVVVGASSSLPGRNIPKMRIRALRLLSLLEKARPCFHRPMSQAARCGSRLSKVSHTPISF